MGGSAAALGAAGLVVRGGEAAWVAGWAVVVWEPGWAAGLGAGAVQVGGLGVAVAEEWAAVGWVAAVGAGSEAWAAGGLVAVVGVGSAVREVVGWVEEDWAEGWVVG